MIDSFDLVIPCYNEEHVLENTIDQVVPFMQQNFNFQWKIIIADNASTDATFKIAKKLEQKYKNQVVAMHIPLKGRGLALKNAWLTSDAEVCGYMDVDLSTDLADLKKLVEPFNLGIADITYGSRLSSQSKTSRGWKREIISRSYVFILNFFARLQVSDAQCGFKAISTEVARDILPLIEDSGWFFDSELLIVAQHNSIRILEVPVTWTDDPDSRVDILKTAIIDLKGIWRVLRGGIPKIYE
ncbi:MAG: hypothetical protein CL752_04625 [Chloroflexi bacterium]|nr:hypothetical protein [Chloroflexota bacterium]